MTKAISPRSSQRVALAQAGDGVRLTEAAATQAAKDLEALKPARWPTWKLTDVNRRQTALRLGFDDVRDAAVREVLQAAKARVVPVTILRISGSAGVEAVEKALRNQPDLARPRRQAWRDETGRSELALAPMPDDYLQRLRDAAPGIPLQLEVRAGSRSLKSRCWRSRSAPMRGGMTARA